MENLNLSYFYTEKGDYTVISNGGEENERIIATRLTESEAKLIPAAPELLEAALELEAWNKKYPAGRIYPMDMAKAVENELTEIVNKTISAIKKATE